MFQTELATSITFRMTWNVLRAFLWTTITNKFNCLANFTNFNLFTDVLKRTISCNFHFGGSVQTMENSNSNIWPINLKVHMLVTKVVNYQWYLMVCKLVFGKQKYRHIRKCSVSVCTEYSCPFIPQRRGGRDNNIPGKK